MSAMAENGMAQEAGPFPGRGAQGERQYGGAAEPSAGERLSPSPAAQCSLAGHGHRGASHGDTHGGQEQPRVGGPPRTTQEGPATKPPRGRILKTPCRVKEARCNRTNMEGFY